MKQLTMDELLFPQPKKINNESAILEWLKDKSKDYKLLYLNKKTFYDEVESFEISIKDIEDMVKTKTFHFANLSKDIYIWSYSYIDDHWSYDKPKKVYIRAYQVKDRVLLEHHGTDNFTDDIRFPAMEISMYDKYFYPIHFSNREDFIMNDLGFKEIGSNIETFKKHERLFCTVQVTFDELVEYLKGENDE
ncbi:MAG: hypothetical protein AB7E61_07165 [Acholeplasmataceae bacterium]